ncbi:MAG: RNA 2',3'-cyclic phosphodiesterase [Acidobacteria bacterium]|nr:RNA 2',3'-cyclic phosphodiesterase [Acidobacteriota bacterium]
MKLFVAVEIDPAVVDRVAACGEELRRRSARAARARITWVPSDRLHVTLRFIGEVDEPRAQAIQAALRPALPAAPFDLTIEGVGSFPGQGPPRVLWAGIACGLDALRAIEAEVSARLDRCGIPREPRPYHPHVTLARVREAGGLRAAQWLEGLGGRQFGRSRVNAITLFQSRPSPQGHVYVALQRTVLAT